MPRTITMSRKPGTTSSYSAEPSTRELDQLAHWLDTRFSVFGIRFGLDSIMGLVPGVGDLASLGVSTYLIGQGYRLGARKRTLARMGLNVAGDTIFGSIPVLGTLIDVVWKANRANMRLLKRDLERPGVIRRM
jgi:hypothetical protein